MEEAGLKEIKKCYMDKNLEKEGKSKGEKRMKMSRRLGIRGKKNCIRAE
jgi:hypothetical protein